MTTLTIESTCPRCGSVLDLYASVLRVGGQAICPSHDTNHDLVGPCVVCARAVRMSPLSVYGQRAQRRRWPLVMRDDVTCSRRCDRRWLALMNRTSAPCAVCGGDVTAIRPDAVYCSAACRVAAHRARATGVDVAVPPGRPLRGS